MSDRQDTWGRLKAHPREQLKLLFGSVFHPKATRQWVSFVRSHPVLWQQLGIFPKLLTRIYRPYGFQPLNCAQRVDRIMAHYRMVAQQGLDSLLSTSIHESLQVSQVETKTGEIATLRLQAIRDGHREGEMSLQLYWGERFLYSVTFLLTPNAGGCAMLVTRLQGSRDGEAKDLIRRATKSFHGYRPSVLLLQAARQLAHDFGCARVLLVSNRQRVALNPVRRMKIKVDLESLWRDLGAAPEASGFFVVSPQVMIPQDFSDVASNKRAEAKRKAALAGTFLNGVSASVAGLRSMPEH
jgi:uncharacterized protein VirK/YbjX